MYSEVTDISEGTQSELYEMSGSSETSKNNMMKKTTTKKKHRSRENLQEMMHCLALDSDWSAVDSFSTTTNKNLSC